MKYLIVISAFLIITGCTSVETNNELNSYRDLQEFQKYLIDGNFKSIESEDKPTIFVSPQACQTEVDFIMFVTKKSGGKCYDIKSDAELTFGDYKDYLPEKNSEILLYKAYERYHIPSSYDELIQFLDTEKDVIPIPNEFKFYNYGLDNDYKDHKRVVFKTVIEDLNVLRGYYFYKFNDNGFYLQIVDDYELEDWENKISSDYVLPDAKYLGSSKVVSFTYFQTDQFYDNSYSNMSV